MVFFSLHNFLHGMYATNMVRAACRLSAQLTAAPGISGCGTICSGATTRMFGKFRLQIMHVGAQLFDRLLLMCALQVS